MEAMKVQSEEHAQKVEYSKNGGEPYFGWKFERKKLEKMEKI